MSTTFTLLSDPHEERVIALRFCGPRGRTVRFAFPEVLLTHLRDAEIIGENCETTTIGDLFESAREVDFLEKDVTPRDHLGWGTQGARDTDKFLTGNCRNHNQATKETK